MAGSMKQADLIHDLRLMLGNAKDRFESDSDAEFILHLETAAFDFSRYRPRTKVGTITLVSDQSNYVVPADYMRFKTSIWGLTERRQRKQWEGNWPGSLPNVSVIEGVTSTEFYLDPAPTAAQIADLGSAYKFYYYAAHAINIDATKTTIKLHDRSLFLLRALSAALSDLATMGVVAPVVLGDGAGSMSKNGTPAALAEASLKLFERMAA